MAPRAEATYHPFSMTTSTTTNILPGAWRSLSAGLFVTGTDTGVGKTEIAAALARLLCDGGVRVRPRKPVESGCAERDGRPFPGDAARLQRAARSTEPLEAVCAYALAAAVSPERAASLEGRAIRLADLERACRTGVGANDFLLVEAAGGVLTPLTPDAVAADLAARIALPVVLVVADRLGCINHALLSIEALAARGLTPAAVVLNRVEAAGPPGMDNRADLEIRLRQPLVYVPHVAGPEPWRAAMPHLRAWAATLSPACPKS